MSNKLTTAQELRERLHSFAVSYHFESKESRKEDLDQILQLIQQTFEDCLPTQPIMGVDTTCMKLVISETKANFKRIMEG